MEKKDNSFRYISNILYNSYLPVIINTAINIGIFELLNSKAMSLDEICRKLETRKNVTEELLNVLDAIELIEKKNDVYGLTQLSSLYMVQSSEIEQLDEIKSVSIKNTPFDDLEDVLKGKANIHDRKMSGKHPKWNDKRMLMQMIRRAKAGSVQNVSSFVEALPGFEDCRKMIDFAGSAGYYALGIIERNKNLKAYVYDLPEVCEQVKVIQKDEPGFERVKYCGFDFKNNDSFGDGYDLFLVSNFLYSYNTMEKITGFLKRVNVSMKKGSFFVSNHRTSGLKDDSYVRYAIFQLQGIISGRPTHMVDETFLKEALTATGFGNFIVRQPDNSLANPSLLLAAEKIKDI